MANAAQCFSWEKKKTKLNIDFYLLFRFRSFLFDKNRTLIEFAARSLCIEFTVVPFFVPIHSRNMAGRWIDIMSYTTFIRSMTTTTTTSSCLSPTTASSHPSHWLDPGLGQKRVTGAAVSCSNNNIFLSLNNYPISIRYISLISFSHISSRSVRLFWPGRAFFFSSPFFLCSSSPLGNDVYVSCVIVSVIALSITLAVHRYRTELWRRLIIASWKP